MDGHSASLEVGDQLTLTVEAAALSGRLLSRAPDGRVTWLDGLVAVGDEVRVELTKVQSKSLEARVLERLTKGEGGVEPFCSEAERCGGCPWQALSDEAQLNALSADLKRGVSRAFPHLSAEALEGAWVSPFSSPERAWRHTARLHLKVSAQETTLGFFGRDGLFSLKTCPTFCPTLNALLASAQAHLVTALSSLSSLAPLEGELRVSAALKASSGTASLSLKEPLSDQALASLKELLSAWFEVEPALHGLTLSAPELKVSAPPQRKPKHGQKHGHKRGQKRDYRRSAQRTTSYPVTLQSWGEAYNELPAPHPAGAFMQAHQEGNQALTAEVVSRVAEASSVLELYAGSGNLSLALAEANPSRALTCVEGDPEAVRALNALAQGRFERLSALRHDLRRPPRELLGAFLAGEHEHLVLDPPRAGAKELCEALAEMIDEHPTEATLPITYISCHPAALQRDLKTLGEAGWRPQTLRLFHLFPHTGHAEVCVTLTRA